MQKKALQAKFDLTGRTAIVTGGTRGIGLAIAEGLIGAGANVAIASRKPDACEATAQRLQTMGGKAIGVPTHLGDIRAINTLVEATAGQFGGIDIVINNAANPLAQTLGDISPEAWEKSFAVNLQGPVFLVQAALPYLRDSRHAAILNVVSVGAFIFSPWVSMYTAAKAAMVSFTRSMAAEFASAGIRVNALAPGSVDTDMVRKNPPEFIKAMEASCLMQRIAQPDEMVPPALLLVSDAGSFITGQTLIADGGMAAR
ncbi:short-chain dehydrogenase/reductase [Mycobacterium saskatchewanense]|uniref:Oxidoreductase n=1 Tax=Mycobacterium saskatchewanense TaxID=220927 RepID=A0AAJ3TXI1_9MYCO|nr:glucose 1-dehydrogenase [Mycobacterium saskatchewanense]ORW72649.1 oxidoreductase [Mycobacterium saskatchewanense]BBX65999.1 short-chain dehydrogenase/reductase [Mycobacterium saskatchewanense]